MEQEIWGTPSLIMPICASVDFESAGGSVTLTVDSLTVGAASGETVVTITSSAEIEVR